MLYVHEMSFSGFWSMAPCSLFGTPPLNKGAMELKDGVSRLVLDTVRSKPRSSALFLG